MTLAWNPSTEPGARYRVYYGAASRNYTNIVDAGTATSVVISNLVEGRTFYFAATAYNTLGLESAFSGEIQYVVPLSNTPPGNVPVVTTPGTLHYDFTNANRASLIAAGWDFIARTAAGVARNTEQTSGAVVSYDQAARPGVLLIPADVGDLWASINNTRNSIFRGLPADWTSIRLKLAFAPTRDWQQASIVAYQNDDNYLQVTREFNSGNGGNAATFVAETAGSPATIRSVAVSATSNLHLRLDRDVAVGTFYAYYSLTGTNWVSLGSTTRTLTNPRLGIIVGSSPAGYPNADLSWVEIISPSAAPALTVSPKNLTFSTAIGANPVAQIVGITNSGSGPLTWTALADGALPAWLSVSPTSGTNNGKITVSVASAGLAAGSYSKTITVAATGATNSPQTVTVNLTVTNASGLPIPWQTTDIGSVAATGSASMANGLYTVRGAGNISGTADNFRFAYQPLTGDGEIKVRLNSVGNTGSGGRSGVMIRENLTAGSRYAFMGITPDGQFRWQRRSSTAGSTSSTTSTVGTTPNVWTRLVRSGNTFYGYKSTDGSNWTRVSYSTFTMATNIYVGLAVASGQSNVLNTTTFTNVAVIP